MTRHDTTRPTDRPTDRSLCFSFSQLTLNLLAAAVRLTLVVVVGLRCRVNDVVR